jgi:hypothetical protein
MEYAELALGPVFWLESAETGIPINTGRQRAEPMPMK